MRTWREAAALGYWSWININDIETDHDSTELRWAIDTVLPQQISKAGFEDRTIIPRNLSALLEHINCGNYGKAEHKVRQRLAPAVSLDRDEEFAKTQDAERLLKRYVGEGYRMEISTAQTAWQLNQLRHAFLVMQELDALGADITVPSDEWLRQALNVARFVFEQRGLPWPDGFNSAVRDYASLDHIMIRPTQRATSVPDESKMTWEVRQMSPPEEINPRQPEQCGEPVFGTSVDVAASKEHADAIQIGRSNGWFLLSDLADPNHDYFEFALGHAVSIARLAEDALRMVGHVERPGPYHPDKSTVIEHMYEMSTVGFEIGRHVQALETAGFVQLVRLAQKQRRDLSKNNPRPKGERTDKTLKVLKHMEDHMEKQRRNGKKRSVAEAARSAVRDGLGTSEEANRKIYYDYRQAGKK